MSVAASLFCGPPTSQGGQYAALRKKHALILLLYQLFGRPSSELARDLQGAVVQYCAKYLWLLRVEESELFCPQSH